MEEEMRYLPLVVLLAFAACESAGGVMKNGAISQCGGHHTDSQACGNAVFNAPLLPKVHAGMTMDEVRAVMQHDAERREIDHGAETWIYMSDYQAEMMTAVTFTDGKVTGMRQIPWKTEK